MQNLKKITLLFSNHSGIIRCVCALSLLVLAMSVGNFMSMQAQANPYASTLSDKENVGLPRTGAAPKRNDAKAIDFAAKRQWAEASAAAAASSNALVSSLVDWYLFRSDVADKNFLSLAEFVNQHSDWPGVSAIRLKAEKAFPSTYPDKYAYQWFRRYPPISYEGFIRYGRALKNLGRDAELRAALKEWFPKAGIKPSEQDRILSMFSQNLTQDILLARLNDALMTDQYTNARAVAKRLPKGYRELTEARIALASKSNGVDDLIAKVPQALRNDAGLIFERAKWRRQKGNNQGAIEVLSQLKSDIPHESVRRAIWNERHILIRDLLEQKQFSKAYHLAVNHKQVDGFPHAQAQWTAGWIALRFVNKPMEAFRRFDSLYKTTETPISRARGAYWAARASEALGDQATAKIWYQAAAQYPTVFYGQMSLDRLGLRANYSGIQEANVDSRTSSVYRKTQAAELLHKAGQQDEVELFLRSMIDDAENGKMTFAELAKLSKRLSAPHLAVHIAKRAERKGHILLQDSFPKIVSYTNRVSFADKALLHGLIRQESGFYTNARSRTGALGLMQLMPPTARETSGKLGLTYSKAALSNNPTYNIQLGSAYIDQMIERFDGSYPLAIAAYNAGPGRVGRWVREMGDPRGLSHEELIDWIEMIPVYETRNYVQRVTEAMRVYDDIFQMSGLRNAQRVAWNKK